MSSRPPKRLLGNESPPHGHCISELNYNPLEAGSIDGYADEPHDRAIIRAILSDYKLYIPGQREIGPSNLTLFVSRLHPKTTDSTLYTVFGRYGPITHLHLVRDIITGESKRYAFISFENSHDFRSCWHRMNKVMVDGAQILVEFERERITNGWVPRRLGGGIGGRKESGQLRFGGRDRPFQKRHSFRRSFGFKPRSSHKPSHPKPHLTEPSIGTIVNFDDDETGELSTLYFKQKPQTQLISVFDIT